MKRDVNLAIETSTPLGSVAVGRGADVLAEAILGIHSRHSEALLSAIDFVLHNAQATKAQIARVVVGGGPGSFTGLRIAGATGKGLSAALGIPMFAYSGLTALATGAAAAGRPVCALFDARRGEVYAACYDFPELSRVETLLEPAPRTIENLLGLLDVPSTLFVGDGATANAEVISTAGGLIAPGHLAVPRASALLWLSETIPAAGRIDDVAAWEPLYIRESGAERMRAK